MTVEYWRKGCAYDFKRFGDCVRRVFLLRWWRSGGLLYGYVDRFNVVSIAIDDIISVSGGEL